MLDIYFSLTWFLPAFPAFGRCWQYDWFEKNPIRQATVHLPHAPTNESREGAPHATNGSAYLQRVNTAVKHHGTVACWGTSPCCRQEAKGTFICFDLESRNQPMSYRILQMIISTTSRLGFFLVSCFKWGRSLEQFLALLQETSFSKETERIALVLLIQLQDVVTR